MDGDFLMAWVSTVSVFNKVLATQRCVHVIRRFTPEPSFAWNQILKNCAADLPAQPGHVQLGLGAILGLIYSPVS
jgi:hypothetical protein